MFWSPSKFDDVAAMTVSGGVTDTAQALAFIARTSPTITGSDATNYKTLINNLVNTNSTISGTLFSRFDILCIYAAPDSANALLSLINGTFSTSLVSTPTFTTKRGFTANGSTAGLTTNYNPFSGGVKWLQDDAHMSVWNLTNITESQPMTTPSNASVTSIYPAFSGTDFYGRLNDGTGGGSYTIPADNRGHLLTTRSSSSARNGYQNANSLGSVTNTSGVLDNGVINPILNLSTRQGAMFSAGAGLSATDVTNFYGFLRTFMTAFGVP